ncbi:MAG: UDP-N-acetylglucosamine pyrophosphorylase [Oscillospiraceae bacterium]|nr:UDP-N-acetylglucosamine pyrophosphorylase [Oscillospiraceae bacterium]MBQ6849995.1 UDP-N-acetylglucosamine pyrophosphorylase [Oscillospiraceae bacterium]MBR6609278.1 UDP-N-acetylglucosamine pyrophosphorylase [Oscillospiraceae bacterium]
MTKLVKTADLYECNVPYLKDLFSDSVYPWDMLGKIKGLCAKLLEEGIEGFTEIETGILVGRDVKIAPTATIIPPAIIGHGTEIRPGAYLRGNVITGENCVLGNSSEFKNCILLDKVQAPHYNYVGDSVLGNKAHMGAGSICSNLKSDGKAVVIHGDDDIETGIRKIGGILADGADIGCQCVINPGTVIGKRTSVYPLTALRGVIPADCIVKSMDKIVIRKA